MRLRYARLCPARILNYGSMTGYELKQNMEGSTSHFWTAKLSQIYTTLKAMEKKGWVRSSIQVQKERPDKRVYTITAEGRSSLQKWLAEPLTELAHHKNTLLLKLFFAAQTDRETTLIFATFAEEPASTPLTLPHKIPRPNSKHRAAKPGARKGSNLLGSHPALWRIV